MKAINEWPMVLTVPDVQECLGIPRQDAYLLFKRPDFPLLIPGKRGNRTVSKKDLLDFLGGKS